MKDPAFLFYPNDWIGGTMGMTFEEKGAYIELLMMQFNRGHMTEHMIAQTIGQLWVNIKDKFIIDNEGRFYNKRLEEEQQKRKAFTESRRNNIKGENQFTKKSGHKKGHMTSHMENENENKDINKNIFDEFRKKYPGTKRGNETEFENLKKKHKDWKEVLNLLESALNSQIISRQRKKEKGLFIPEWKNLQTWINQRCWEEVQDIEITVNKQSECLPR